MFVEMWDLLLDNIFLQELIHCPLQLQGLSSPAFGRSHLCYLEYFATWPMSPSAHKLTDQRHVNLLPPDHMGGPSGPEVVAGKNMTEVVGAKQQSILVFSETLYYLISWQ